MEIDDMKYKCKTPIPHCFGDGYATADWLFWCPDVSAFVCVDCLETWYNSDSKEFQSIVLDENTLKSRVSLAQRGYFSIEKRT